MRSLPLVIYNVDNMAETLGAFEQAVLLALVHPRPASGGEVYGRAILKEVQPRLQRDVSASAVYATLNRLEQKGLISSWTEPGSAVRGGRPRRHYKLESKGLRALHASRAATRRLWGNVRLPFTIKGFV